MDCSIVNLLYIVVFIVASYFGVKYIYRRRRANALANAKTSARDVVTVHCFPPSTTVPNASPFALKLLTFLRAAKIPYEIDDSIPFGPSGKSPWISLNGQQYTDSEVIINMLTKKYDKNFNQGFKQADLSIARAVRVMLEERWFWCMTTWRFVWPEGSASFYNLMSMKFGIPPFLVRMMMGRIFLKQSKAHGVGRFPKDQFISFMLDDMRAVSGILGDKKFILGSEPCQDDFAIFGQLAQAMWGLYDSPYEKFMKGHEGSNLRDYILRMKELYWPDWNSCLLKQ